MRPQDKLYHMKLQELYKVVIGKIDRMNDYCDADPAEKIIDDFLKEANPLVDELIKLEKMR